MIGKAAELEALQDADTLWHGAVAALNRCGIAHVVYLSVDAEFRDPIARCTHDTLYDGWSISEEPFLHHACDSYEILLLGRVYADDYSELSKRERAFIEHAGRVGITAGLGIPMRLAGSERFGGFILCTGLDRDEFEQRIAPRAEEFRLFCLLVHRRFEELAESARRPSDFRHRLIAPPGTGDIGKLTPREREVIYLLAHGQTRQQAAHTCGISVHTVSDYAKSGYRKLGVRNRAQAAALLFAAE